MKKTLLLSLFIIAVVSAKAATTLPVDTGKVAATAPPADPPLIFSGSVDTYWKYDFSKKGNIPTSFPVIKTQYPSG